MVRVRLDSGTGLNLTAAIPDDDKRAAKIKANYERFLHERAGLMLEAIKKLCSGRRWPEG